MKQQSIDQFNTKSPNLTTFSHFKPARSRNSRKSKTPPLCSGDHSDVSQQLFTMDDRDDLGSISTVRVIVLLTSTIRRASHLNKPSIQLT